MAGITLSKSSRSLEAWCLGQRSQGVRSRLTGPIDSGIIRTFTPHYTLTFSDATCSYAWPPHQIMAWVGLERYGYLDEAQRLAYRFLYMCVDGHTFFFQDRWAKDRV